LLARIQRTYEGIVHLKRAVEINPRYVEALSHLGTLLVQAGFESEGSEYIARALEIDPVYPLARRQAALAPVRRSLR
jgi:hypothetical protein